MNTLDRTDRHIATGLFSLTLDYYMVPQIDLEDEITVVSYRHGQQVPSPFSPATSPLPRPTLASATCVIDELEQVQVVFTAM